MAISPNIDRNTAMTTALLLPVARMLWVTAEVEAERALRAWQAANTAQRAGAYTASAISPATASPVNMRCREIVRRP